MNRRERPAGSLLQRAVALLARREHSRDELARKLLRRLEAGQDPGEVEAVLDELQRRDLLSERRYADAVVRTRAARYGNARLAQDLKARGVPADTTKSALAALGDSELQRARTVWARRFGAAPTDLQERARQTRFLERRGFSAAVIRQVLAGHPGPEAEG
jgi:regulatory protein